MTQPTVSAAGTDSAIIPVRVDTLEGPAGQRTWVRVEVPPGKAILSPNGDGPGRQQRPETGRHGRQAVGLERHEHGVRISDGFEVIGGRRVGGEVTQRSEHPNPVRLHGLQVRAPGHQNDVRAGTNQGRPDIGTYRSGADDDNLHVRAVRLISSGILRRCSLPVGVRGRAGST